MSNCKETKDEKQQRTQRPTSNEDYRDWFDMEMSRIRFDLYKVADACLKAGDDAARNMLDAMATIVLEFAAARDETLDSIADKQR
jgi:hypothetical protein